MKMGQHAHRLLHAPEVQHHEQDDGRTLRQAPSRRRGSGAGSSRWPYRRDSFWDTEMVRT